MLGNGRLEAHCFDGVKRLAHIRGALRKKVWINQGDIILVSLREYQDDKADVIQRYNPDEARQLKQYGELPDNTKVNENDTFAGEEDDEVDFEFEIDEVNTSIHSLLATCLTYSSFIDLNMPTVFCPFAHSQASPLYIHPPYIKKSYNLLDLVNIHTVVSSYLSCLIYTVG